jgi:hypothetical protein
MNVRLKKTFDWYSGVVYRDQFIVNHFSAVLDLQTISDDPEQQNIAYDRTKYWFHEIMEDAVLIREDHPNLAHWQDTGARIVPLPDEPVDQLVGIMLCFKLNAIMEDRLIVTDVEISSRAGDSMSYLHNWKENPGPLGTDGWWQDSRPTWNQSRTDTRSKVVNLDRVPEWKLYDLDWDTSADSKSDTVLFAKFDRDAKK